MKSVIAVAAMENRKTGLVHGTYVSQGSCPTSCVLLKTGGCYANNGPVGIHTRRLNRANDQATPIELAREEAREILAKLTGVLDTRLHVVGDCASTEAVTIVAEAVNYINRRGHRAWTYTHAWRDADRQAWSGVSVLASCETPAAVEQAHDAGWPTAIVVERFKQESLYEDQGTKILPCPNQTRHVQCVDCRLCMNADRLAAKGITIGFQIHGATAKARDALALAAA